MANNISRANRIKRSPGDAFVQVLLYVFVALFAIATVIPFLYVLAGSFATEQELTEKSFFLFPTVFSTNAYSYIVKDGSIFRGLANSLLVTAVGTFINILWHVPTSVGETVSERWLSLRCCLAVVCYQATS